MKLFLSQWNCQGKLRRGEDRAVHLRTRACRDRIHGGMCRSVSIVRFPHALALVVSSMVVLNSATGRTLVLVEKGQARGVIVTAANPPYPIRLAVQVFRQHIEQMSRARLPVRTERRVGELVVKEGQISPSRELGDVRCFVLIGRSSLTDRLHIKPDTLGPGGIIVRTTSNALVLLGADQHWADRYATFYAVTSFLEEELGCRYLFPGELGKVIPQQGTIRVPQVDRSFTPILQQRRVRSLGFTSRVKVGLKRLMFDKREFDLVRGKAFSTSAESGSWFLWHRLGGSLGISAGHAFGHLWKKYGEEHPEWFALQPNGSRDQSSSPDRARLCVSNLELIETIAKEKIEEIRSSKAPIRSVSISPNDGGRTTFCLCPGCRKLDPPEGREIKLRDFSSPQRRYLDYVSLTDRMVYFWNEIAKRVTRVYPDALLSAYAYSLYSAPPVRRKLHPNIVIGFVPIHYLREEARKEGLNDWTEWARMASKIYWRPNLLLSGHREGTLALYVHKLADDFRYLAHNKMVGTDFDSCIHHWATQGLNYYVCAKLHWNPDLDVERLVDDYCRAGFGAGADYIKAYFLQIEKLTDKIAREELSITKPYTPEVIARLKALLDRAERVEPDEVVRKRIEFLRKGLEFTDLQARAYRYLAQEKPDREAFFRLLDRKYYLMREIFLKYPLAVNVAWVCWGEWGRFASRGWKPPREKILREMMKEGGVGEDLLP